LLPLARFHHLLISALVALLALSVSHCSAPASYAATQIKGPVTLLGLREHQTLQWPSIAVRMDTAFIAGNIFAAESLIARPAYLGRVHQNGDGSLIPLAPLELPPGDFQFAYPRIAWAGDTLHLVWAEFESRPLTVTDWRFLTIYRLTSLWHAQRVHGAWSPPKRIATAYSFGWNAETGGVAVDARGTLHVAVRKADIRAIPHVHDYRFVNGQWEDSPLPYTGLNEATAIATRGDTIVVAVVDEPRFDSSRVMVIESTDHGAYWTNPIVASSRPRLQGKVTRLAFARMPDGLLLAVGEKPNDSFYLDTIRIVRLKGAIRPPATRFIEPPETIDGFELAMAPCDSAVMVLQTFSLKPQLYELRLPIDSAAPVIRPLSDAANMATFPGIASGRRSPIAVFFEMGTPWRTVAMTVRACSL
jgi:hypothetical protein